MWLWLSLSLCAVLVAVAAWHLPARFWSISRQHKSQFEQQTAHHLAARFIFIKAQAIGRMALSVLAVLVLLLGLLGVAWWLVLGFIVLLVLLWPFYLKRLRLKRISQLEKQFPDYLLALAGALRTGSSLAVAMQRITPLSHTPLSQELGLVLKEQRLGLSLSQALVHLYTRMPCESTILFKSALAVAGQSGGSLAELLETMAQTISQRLYIEGRIRTLTAQGRMQAWIMAALPVLVGGALYFIDPLLMSPLWQHGSGQIVLVVVIVLELVGLWLISKIVNVHL